MKLSEIILFLMALLAFVFGVNHMVTKKSGRAPIDVEKLMDNLKNEQHSELNQALKKVTSTAKGEVYSIENQYASKKQHIDFLLSRAEYKSKTCEFIESELQTFDYTTTNYEAMDYLDKLFDAYLKSQKEPLQSVEIYKMLQKNMAAGPRHKSYETMLLQAYPNDQQLIQQKLQQSP